MSIFGFEILLNISIVSAFLPFAMLLTIKNSTFLNFKKVLLFLTSFWIVTEGVNFMLAHSGLNTYLNVHIFDIVSTLIYIQYYKLMFKSKKVHNQLNYLGLAYLIAVLSNLIFNQAFFEPLIFNVALTMLIPFTLSLLTFYNLAKEASITNLLREPTYWINSAILIHFGMSITGVLISDIMYHNLNLHLYIWPVVIISNIIYNILFTIGVWQMRRT